MWNFISNFTHFTCFTCEIMRSLACENYHVLNLHVNYYSGVEICMILRVKIHMLITFTSFRIWKSHDLMSENSHVSNSHVNFTRLNSCGIFAISHHFTSENHIFWHVKIYMFQIDIVKAVFKISSFLSDYHRSYSEARLEYTANFEPHQQQNI